MAHFLDILAVMLILSNFAMIGSSRLITYIKAVAVQGLILGMITLVSAGEFTNIRFIILGFGNIALKSMLVPYLFLKAIREVRIRREDEPIVSFSFSILFGIISFSISLWLSTRLPVFSNRFSIVTVATVFFMMFTGLFLIVSRHKAISQVVGYLVFENGVYLFGICSVVEAPLFVELGVFLDVVVTVFIMAIIVHHVDRRFDTKSHGFLDKLRD